MPSGTINYKVNRKQAKPLLASVASPPVSGMPSPQFGGFRPRLARSRRPLVRPFSSVRERSRTFRARQVPPAYAGGASANPRERFANAERSRTAMAFGSPEQHDALRREAAKIGIALPESVRPLPTSGAAGTSFPTRSSGSAAITRTIPGFRIMGGNRRTGSSRRSGTTRSFGVLTQKYDATTRTGRHTGSASGTATTGISASRSTATGIRGSSIGITTTHTTKRTRVWNSVTTTKPPTSRSGLHSRWVGY